MGNLKKVFVTGASAGFGYDTSKALAEKGHTVYATMRGVTGKNASKAESLKSWAKSHGHELHIIDLDVTNEASVRNAVSAAMELGGVDVLLNNAGVGTWGIDEGYSIEQAQQIFDINVFGAMRVSHAVLPHFRKAGKGLVMYVSSGLGRIVLPFMAVYTASKFALEGYAESASYELSPLGIQTVIVQPGAFGTTFLGNSQHPKKDVGGEYGPTATMFNAFSNGFEARAKSGGLGNPKEVVEAIVEEVERGSGERPLRRTIGKDVQEGVGAINGVCSQVQSELLKAFGMK